MWLPGGWEDYLYWQQIDRKMVQKINDLIRDALRNPFTGIGKPEPLKGTCIAGGHGASTTNVAWSTALRTKS